MPSAVITPLAPSEYPLLRDFLRLAIFVAEVQHPPPASFVDADPIAQRYVDRFGSRVGDTAVAARAAGQVVGVAWGRLFDAERPGYGFIDAATPEVGAALLPEWRGHGIGTMVFEALLA